MTHCYWRGNRHYVGFLDQQLSSFMADFSDLGFGDRSASPQLGDSSGKKTHVKAHSQLKRRHR